MLTASHLNHEVKHEVEVNNIAVLKKLKLFFMNNKYKGSESQDCDLYNSVLEAHQAILVYVEDERVHKLFVNDEPLEPQDSIKVITRMVNFLQTLSTQSVTGISTASSSPRSSANTVVKAYAERDVITVAGSVTAGGTLRIGGGDTVINNPVYVSSKSVLDEATLALKEKQAITQLKASYLESEHASIQGIFGMSLKLEGQYINLQMLCVDLKNKKIEENKDSKDLAETKNDEKYKDARMASVEDLFGDKRAIKVEDLFKPTQALFGNQDLKTVKNADESPHLLLVQGRAGIGKTTFVRYVAHEWSKGQLYPNYTWAFTLTLRNLRLLPNTQELNLSEWVRLSQFSDWPQKEFDVLWRQRIESAINQNKVLLILDGYDEVPENHPCQSALKDLLTPVGIYAKLSLLITTRPCSAGEISERRRNLEIIGFTDENINQYIQTYFLKTSNKTLVHNLTETLRKQPVIWANAHIPLNLNLLCGIMEEAIQKAHIEGLTQGFAQLSSMTRLYEVMEKKLYERSHSRHDTGSLKIGRQLIRAQTDFIKHYQKERLFLAKLAFQSFEAECIIIPIQIIGDALQSYVDREVTQGSQRNIQQAKEKLAEVFFDEVCRLGLIKPVLDRSIFSQAQQDYEFLHLTFQEYYTAIYLAEGFSSEELQVRFDAEKVILKEKYNPRWQIVWWFVAGLLRENARAYGGYLQQLQGQYKGQMLTQDMLEHYQLGLLARCVDEGFQSSNQQAIEPIVKQLRLKFLTLYQTAKHVKNNNNDLGKQVSTLISSPFFSACRISPNLCMSDKQDLYALIPEPSESSDKQFLLVWICETRVVTLKALDVLTGLFADKDRDVRYVAAVVAGELGAAVTPKLLDAVAGLFVDKDSEVRRSVKEAVGKLGAAAATPKLLDTLLGLFSDKDCDVRGSAAMTVGNLGAAVATPKVLDALLRLFADEDPHVRSSAASAVGELGAGAETPKLMDALLELFADENYWVRTNAVSAVGELVGVDAATPKLMGALLGLLGDKDKHARSSAAEAVGKLGVAVTPKLLDALAGLFADKDPDVRSSVAEAVGNLGAAVVTSKLLDTLAELLADKDSGGRGDVRCFAVAALSKLGAAAATPKLLLVLLGLLVHEDFQVRSSAAWAAGRLDAVMPQLLDALGSLLAHERSQVRCSAAEAVGKLGGAAATPKLLDGLLELLSDKDMWVRSSAAKAVGNLGAAIVTPNLLSALLGLLADKNMWVRSSAVSAAGKLGAAATPKLLDTLLGLLVDKDRYARRSAAEAMGNLGGAAATPKLLDALAGLFADKERDVRLSAAEAVGKLGADAVRPKLLDALMGLLSDKDMWVRSSAAKAVGNLGADAVRPKLLDALMGLLSDKDDWVRRSAAEAVGNLGVGVVTPRLLDTLAGMLADEDRCVLGNVCCYATEAVGNLGAAAVTPNLLDALLGLLVDKDFYVPIYATKALDKLGSVATTPFLHQLLDTYSVPGNDKALCIFGLHIDSVFTLMPSFCAENANHPNLFAFVSYTLAVAYLSSHISCQIDFDKEGEPAGYYMQGFVEKSRYRFLITERQAQSLRCLLSLVIEQLSKTGKLDILELKRHLPERERIAQNLLLGSREYAVSESRDITRHLPANFSGAWEQKGFPMLTQYEQSGRPASEVRANQSYREVKNTCRIS